jgi:hypothetical protein
MSPGHGPLAAVSVQRIAGESESCSGGGVCILRGAPLSGSSLERSVLFGIVFAACVHLGGVSYSRRALAARDGRVATTIQLVTTV